MSQPIETFVPNFAAIAAPVARETKPVTATRLPMPILVISGGSRNFFDRSRQKITESARKLTDIIESRMTRHIVRIFLPKKLSSVLLFVQDIYVVYMCLVHSTALYFDV